MEQNTAVLTKEIAKSSDLPFPMVGVDESSPSYDEALENLKKYDAKIKELAKNRLPNPEIAPEPEINSKVVAPLAGIGTGIGLAISLVSVANQSGTMEFNELISMLSLMLIGVPSTGIGMVGALSGEGVSLPKPIARILFQKRFARAKAEYDLEQHICDKSEKEYQKKVLKVLKKAMPSLYVINNNTVDKRLSYNDERGQEGFALVDREEPVTMWDTLALNSPFSKQYGLLPENRKLNTKTIVVE